MTNHHDHRRRPGQQSRLGFTVPEFSMALAVVAIVGAGMMATYLFGAKMCAKVQLKLDTASDVRDQLVDFSHAVRTAVNFEIGQGTATTFTPVADGQPRQGNAIQIYSTATTNDYLRYYLDVPSKTLYYIDSDADKAYWIAQGITNTMPFTAEDIAGNLTTNDVPKEIVGMTLQFSLTPIKYTTNDATNVKDSYQVRTRIALRNGLGYQQ